MNIVLLHNLYLIGGGEDQVVESEASLLREHGHEVTVLQQDNRDIEAIGRAKTAMRTLWSGDSYERVYSTLTERRFDIVHVHNFFPLWSPSIYYAAQRRRVPVVQTLHNYRLLCASAYLYRNGGVCEKCLGRFVPWSGILHSCYRDSMAGSAVLAGMIGLHKATGTWSRRVNLYIAPSEFAKSKFVAAGWPSDKIAVKPNFLHPAPAPGSGGGGYALFVGRLSEEKGIRTLLSAWDAAMDPLPLKIVGEGPLAEVVQERAGKNLRIEYLGKRTNSEVIESLGHAEFLVFTSEWFETSSRIIIESLAAGTPVIASNIGAPASIITNGKDGFLFPAGDASELAILIDRCSKELREIQAMRPAARATFEREYTGETNIKILLGCYRKAQSQN